MSTSEKKLHYSFEEYLAREEQSDYKSEFYKGEIYAMSGGTGDHSLIGTNITRELGNALMGKDCFVYGSDLKIRIEEANAAVYPDGMIICGPRKYYKDRLDMITNPMVVIEVLSEGTAGWDRGGKFRQYTLLPSLREYVIVEQAEAQVDVFRKNDAGLWEFEAYGGLDSNIEIKSLGISISLVMIYYGVQFGA
ncbi:MAG: Uma2 family endonuclease [Bacteroidia bacterium]|nr:Uma2 family endonuclease [Bacteroidia bacterium]